LASGSGGLSRFLGRISIAAKCAMPRRRFGAVILIIIWGLLSVFASTEQKCSVFIQVFEANLTRI
jgi:hypothetical protein